MAFLSRLMGLFGGRKADPAPAPAAPPPARNPRAAPTPPVPAEPRIFVGWTEMIDAKARIGAYLLAPNGLQAGATVSGPQLLEALERERVARFAERRPVLIPITPTQWAAADFRRIAAPLTVFLLRELPTHAAARQALLAELRSHNLRVALVAADWTSDDPACAPDMLLVDLRSAPLARIEAQVQQIRRTHPRMVLAAENLDSWSEHRLCQSLGFAYSLGAFTTTADEPDETRQISGSRLVVLELLNLLRTEAPPAQIVATAKRDPAIVLRLLALANSPAYGLAKQVSNLEEMMMVLGRDALYRWLAVALFRLGHDDGRDQTLLVVALGRAGFLESLVLESERATRDELFLVGLLSVIDSLLGQPMDKVLDRMTLPPAVTAALLRRDGPYAPYLFLVTALERCRLDQAAMVAEALKIDTAHLIDCYSQAMEWATDELMRD
ncbi:MAG TPA: HDOD domain-containing protein [Zoogloea sp.]|uniref:EAL and HDOD domain-containing protein n=1 Tax=Zoogloea sp. TaxID=49181 RepID=UPI002C6648BE|nr:HDOD domain-containing protein [Zoogloea sp.]HMV16798.1 HDOD domain-containing protein [Rhodocyclaceae bacterium]HMV61966.1 HDOD domain-containing protein [Rhodocyclaceae bacterium]HMW51486.1 HDOD domain-containing protein [Rhodocyclaceae bacterium]HMY49624.1 HDOD domain-containing protein [Rhodocyclaceae bacterium]HMZ76019.1 HDOD domain-containing protein [Rhodocyclaceae bacterium]